LEPLLPTLRKRQRYIAVEVLSKTFIQRNAFINAVSQSGRSLLGDVGFAKCGISVLGFENNLGIIRCTHTSVSETVGILAFIKIIDGEPVILRTLGVSGTIKGAEVKYLQKKKVQN